MFPSSVNSEFIKIYSHSPSECIPRGLFPHFDSEVVRIKSSNVVTYLNGALGWRRGQSEDEKRGDEGERKSSLLGCGPFLDSQIML